MPCVAERDRLEMALRAERLGEDFDPSSNEAKHYDLWAAEIESKAGCARPMGHPHPWRGYWNRIAL
jgi:hypothetical protein